MAELIQVHRAINLNTFSDCTYYGLESCLCSIDIKLTAPLYEANGELRSPIDLVAVIDRSGSMSGEKLNLVIKVLRFVAKHLKSVDRLAIVTYDDNIHELVSLAYVTQTNRIQFDAKISNICSGGLPI
ncbi:hypothetical protein LOD99_3393 [Oopsacas minuta]|uniref:VWFA domain-containing protein n=1 Tax=Oopsacas minuta TaxID=111878 RepID=A0AAV7JXA0_9METZ|nr:hypothetical protein LOD99_3393 [Oopsacas minuta]